MNVDFSQSNQTYECIAMATHWGLLYIAKTRLDQGTWGLSAVSRAVSVQCTWPDFVIVYFNFTQHETYLHLLTHIMWLCTNDSQCIYGNQTIFYAFKMFSNSNRTYIHANLHIKIVIFNTIFFKATSITVLTALRDLRRDSSLARNHWLQ